MDADFQIMWDLFQYIGIHDPQQVSSREENLALLTSSSGFLGRHHFLCFTGKILCSLFCLDNDRDELIKCFMIDKILMFMLCDRWFPGTLAVGSASCWHSFSCCCGQLLLCYSRKVAGNSLRK